MALFNDRIRMSTLPQGTASLELSPTGSDLRKTVLASIVFYLLLIAAIAVTAWGSSPERLLTIEHLVVAVVPFVILLVVSGKLAEIRGPGDVGLILRREASREFTAETSGELPQAESVLRELEQQFGADSRISFPKGAVTSDLGDRIRDARPSVLSFTIGERYSSEAIKEYVRLHTKYSPRFKYIVFNDESDRFEGVMRFEDFLHQLDLEPGGVITGTEAPERVDDTERTSNDVGYATGMVGDIEAGDVLTHAAVVTRSIPTGSSRKRALREMNRVNGSLLAVVDDTGRYAGVVTQDGIVRELLTDLLRESSP